MGIASRFWVAGLVVEFLISGPGTINKSWGAEKLLVKFLINRVVGVEIECLHCDMYVSMYVCFPRKSDDHRSEVHTTANPLMRERLFS